MRPAVHDVTEDWDRSGERGDRPTGPYRITHELEIRVTLEGGAVLRGSGEGRTRGEARAEALNAIFEAIETQPWGRVEPAVGGRP